MNELRKILNKVRSRASVFIARQHAVYAERDIVLANPSVGPSVTLWYCI